MEAYNGTTESKFYTAYEKTRSWFAVWLGVIITLVGVITIFIVASLEGTKEVKASNRESAELMTIWRENNEKMYPEEKVDIINYKNKDYYFVIDKINEETSEILKWHFSYDGGLDYVFQDYKYYVLTALTIAIAMYVSQINYVSTVRNNMENDKFKGSLRYYQEQKEKNHTNTQYTPNFCSYKNKQAYENAVRDIVEEAGINYDNYILKDFDKTKLDKWQIRKLKKIRKIKIKRIYSSDLLQEKGYNSRKVIILPMGQKEHQSRFLISGGIQKTITSALSGLVVSFGIVLGNWYLGLAYGATIFFSFVSAIIIATDFTNTTLRNRFIAKGDLLNEFYNIKEMFIPKKEEVKESEEHGDNELENICITE